jgi:hypothetical protein
MESCLNGTMALMSSRKESLRRPPFLYLSLAAKIPGVVLN